LSVVAIDDRFDIGEILRDEVAPEDDFSLFLGSAGSDAERAADGGG
jgi:hypothetical protein